MAAASLCAVATHVERRIATGVVTECRVGNTLAVLHGTELHGGQDLEHAYRCCEIAADAAPATPASTFARAARALDGFLTDVGNLDLSSIAPQSQIVTAVEPVSRATMRVLFRCRPRTLEFTARHVLGTEDFELSQAGAGTARDCDVLVTDHPALDAGAWTREPAIRVVPWLRERAQIGPTWPQTLERLPRSLRKELKRWLGKRDYRARIVAGMSAKLEFYERHLLPYLGRRFGAGAVAPNARTYAGEARVSVLFELRAGEEFLGASLLKRDGDTLCIGRTAYARAGAAPGEVLDFLCLVLAQRLGCRWLDFGLTRPHIDDGVFLYKAKWRARLVPPGALKSPIRIRPLRASAGTLGFLSRNGFIERRAGKFVVRRLLASGSPEDETLEEIAALAQRAGLDEVVLAYPRAGGIPRPPPARVRLSPLERPDDLVAAFMRLP